jgi:hypothetical protein
MASSIGDFADRGTFGNDVLNGCPNKLSGQGFDCDVEERMVQRFFFGLVQDGVSWVVCSKVIGQFCCLAMRVRLEPNCAASELPPEGSCSWADGLKGSIAVVLTCREKLLQEPASAVQKS